MLNECCDKELMKCFFKQMDKDKKKNKSIFSTVILFIAIVLIIIVVIFGLRRSKESYEETIDDNEEKPQTIKDCIDTFLESTL